MSNPDHQVNLLPPLTFSSLRVGRKFGPSKFRADAGMIATYIAVTGDDDPVYTDTEAARSEGLEAPIMPPGLAGVWARQAYLAEHRMLPGGVMAGQDYHLGRPVPVGTSLTLTAEVLDLDEDPERRKVVLECRAQTPDGSLAGIVRIDARWPEGES